MDVRKKDALDLLGLFRKGLSKAMFYTYCPSEMMQKVLKSCDGILLAKTMDRSVLSSWCFTRAWLCFIREGHTQRATELLQRAIQTNRFIPEYLFRKGYRLKMLPAHLSMGGEDEAQCYAHQFGGILGLICGYFLCLYLQTIPFSGGRTYDPQAHLHISLSLGIYVQALLLSLFSSSIASILPARAASKFTPIEIIRSGA